ncbi:MAG TPA: redoxin domain-containing protein [Micromonosporaceae bacterium]|nr:redoxin domain-containing protein [Micromonosporaceae bacterium]
MVARQLGRLLIVAAVVALTACGGADDPADPAGEALLDFTATTVDGKAFDGRSLAGKPAVLWFWAPWCPVCLGQAPGVRETAEEYGGRVAVVGVAGLDKAEAMPEFIRLAKVESVPHLSDEAGEVWKRFGVTAQSTFVLIDADGTVTFKGRLDADEVADRAAALLG